MMIDRNSSEFQIISSCKFGNSKVFPPINSNAILRVLGEIGNIGIFVLLVLWLIRKIWVIEV